jgi:biuret amidohydrolase
VQRLLAAARSLGVRVIHTREGHRPDLTDLTQFKRRRTLGSGAPIGSPGPLGRLLVRGEYGHGIIDEVAPLPAEVVIDKPGFGAFYATDLELLLRAGGITHLALAGVTTDICVHTTLREAIDRGFDCTTIADACAAGDPEVHAVMLRCIAGEGNILGQVLDSADVIAQWRASAAQ